MSDLPKDYLGDSVYVQQGSYVGELILTTENGFGPTNTIVIGPGELESLLRFRDAMKERYVQKEEAADD